MRLVRPNTFETNSSSTHALVIPYKVQNKDYELYDSLEHNYSYGREESRLVDHWDEKLAYLYITIHELVDYEWDKNQYKITQNMVNSFKDRINKIYEEVYNIVEYKPYERDPKPNDIFNYIDREGKDDLVKDANVVFINDEWFRPYVDHVGEFADKNDFFDKVFNDDEFLKRFIFNKKSYITIGGDEYRGYNIKTIGFEYDYGDMFDDDNEFWKKLEEYKKENDVYLKGC